MTKEERQLQKEINRDWKSIKGAYRQARKEGRNGFSFSIQCANGTLTEVGKMILALRPRLSTLGRVNFFPNCIAGFTYDEESEEAEPLLDKDTVLAAAINGESAEEAIKNSGIWAIVEWDDDN